LPDRHFFCTGFEPVYKNAVALFKVVAVVVLIAGATVTGSGGMTTRKTCLVIVELLPKTSVEVTVTFKRLLFMGNWMENIPFFPIGTAVPLMVNDTLKMSTTLPLTVNILSLVSAPMVGETSVITGGIVSRMTKRFIVIVFPSLPVALTEILFVPSIRCQSTENEPSALSETIVPLIVTFDPDRTPKAVPLTETNGLIVSRLSIGHATLSDNACVFKMTMRVAVV